MSHELRHPLTPNFPGKIYNVPDEELAPRDNQASTTQSINCKEISEEFELALKKMLNEVAAARDRNLFEAAACFYNGKREAILEIMLWLKEH